MSSSAVPDAAQDACQHVEHGLEISIITINAAFEWKTMRSGRLTKPELALRPPLPAALACEPGCAQLPQLALAAVP